MILANPTHKRFERQYNSIMYDFKPKDVLEIPDWPKSIGQDLLKMTHSLGIYEIKPDMTQAQISEAEKNGLKRFMEGYLSTSERNHVAYQDAVQQSGRTVNTNYDLLKVQKDKKEIAQFIGYEAEKMGNTSYLPEKKEEVKEKVKAV